MKLALALLTLAAASVASAADPFQISNATSASTAITTTVTVGRVQGDPAPDGSLVLTVFLTTTKTASDGSVISSTFGTSQVQVPVTGQLMTDLSAAIAAAVPAPAK